MPNDKPAKEVKLKINLLNPQGEPSRLPTKIFSWALSFGRYIGIVVEILVLIAFAARFKLDADLADINEKINKQVPYIQSLSSKEQQVRQTQFKLGVIKQNLNAIPNWPDIFNTISAQVPVKTVFNNLTIEQAKTPDRALTFKIVGIASSNNDIAVILNGLKHEKKFTNVNLASLNLEESGLVFTVTGGVK